MEEKIIEEREKVNVEPGKTVMLYESDRDVEMEEIKDYCEANEWEVPEEDSSEYWQRVEEIREPEYDNFISNLEYSKKLPEKVVITGSAGLWDGRHEIVPVVSDLSDPKKFFGKFIPNCCDFALHIGYDEDGLFVNVPHHDGTNCYRIHEVTPAGQRYIDRCKKHGVTADQLTEDERFIKKIDYWLF